MVIALQVVAILMVTLGVFLTFGLGPGLTVGGLGVLWFGLAAERASS